MQLTRFTDYTLRTLILLGVRRDEVISVSEISAFFDISSHHVAKVAQWLANEGLIDSLRGRHGGLRLAAIPADVSIGDIVRRVEHLELLECFDPITSSCPITGACGLEDALHEARAAFLKILDGVTLEDAVRRSHSVLIELGRKR